MADRVKRLAEVQTDDNNVGVIRQQGGDYLENGDDSSSRSVGLNANWSPKTSDGGGVSSAAYMNCLTTMHAYKCYITE